MLGDIIFQILNGLSLGFLLFIFSVGFSLVFGLMQTANLAHGSLYLVGAYMGLGVFVLTKNFILSVVAAGVGSGLVALGMERFFFSKLYKKDNEQILLAFGLIYVFTDLIRWIWGTDIRTIPAPEVLSRSVELLGSEFPAYRLGLIAIGLILAIGLWYFQKKTMVGAMIRAGVDDEQMVRGLGINIPLVFTIVFSISGFLAGAAGLLGAPFMTIYGGLDIEVLIYALIIVVLGGMGSIIGTLLGSILVGLVINLSAFIYVGIAAFALYFLMAIILIFKPEGLMGKEI